jgi:hypothetical protein
MKTLSKLALAAVLATGASSVALVAPVQAKDKKEEAQGSSLKLSKPIQAIAFNAQAAIKAHDFATAEPLVAQIETTGTTDDDKYIAAALRYDLENNKLAAQQQANPNAPIDQTVLAKPLDALIAAKNTPPADRGKYLFARGKLAANSGQYPVAVQYYTQAKQAGYSSPDFALELAQLKVRGGDIQGGLGDLDAAMTAQQQAGTKPPEDYYRYAIATANKANQAPVTLAWMKKYVVAYPTQKVWRDVILQYAFAQNSPIKPDKLQTVDLFRLMRASGSLSDQAIYEEYGYTVNNLGNPYEAQAVLKEGRASGKIPATSKLTTDTLGQAVTAIRNDSLPKSEAQAKAAKDGKISAQTADAYLGQGNYAKAVELYRAALSKGGVNADEVNTHLGIALAYSGDKAGAATAFNAVTSQPRAGIASLWTTWLQSGPTAGAAAA